MSEIVILTLMSENESLRAKNKELLEALEGLTVIFESIAFEHLTPLPNDFKYYKKAKQAIQKAKEE